MSSTDSRVTDAVHGQRLDAIEKTLAEFRGEFRESLKPLAAEVRVNTSFRERWSGAIRLGAFLVTLLATGAMGWLSFVTYTTIVTKHAVQTLTDEVRNPSKAPEHAAEQ